MDNLHIIIVILSIIIVILSILVFTFKDKGSEYFQECPYYPGKGNIPPAKCDTVGCDDSYDCIAWCGIHKCSKTSLIGG